LLKESFLDLTRHFRGKPGSDPRLARLGNRIISAGKKGIAAEDAACGKKAAPDESMGEERLFGILRTRGEISARRGPQGRKAALIEIYE